VHEAGLMAFILHPCQCCFPAFVELRSNFHMQLPFDDGARDPRPPPAALSGKQALFLFRKGSSLGTTSSSLCGINRPTKLAAGPSSILNIDNAISAKRLGVIPRSHCGVRSDES
jgi:hypothetical protein